MNAKPVDARELCRPEHQPLKSKAAFPPLSLIRRENGNGDQITHAILNLTVPNFTALVKA